MVLTAGSASIFACASPVTRPGARSAPITMRRVWLYRRNSVGPAPKPIWATDFSGTVTPVAAGTGRFSSAARLGRDSPDHSTPTGNTTAGRRVGKEWVSEG